MLNKDQWRLGHRRPWWQWNVLTLAGALFVLVWVRELLDMKQEVWLLCGAIFFLWLVLPIGVLKPTWPSAAEVGADDQSPQAASKSPALRIAIWIFILFLMLQFLSGFAPLALR